MSSAVSPGHLTPAHEAVLIFDFDGTIISVNSLYYWVTAMFMERFGGLSWPQRMQLSLRTAKAVLNRKLRRTTHYETKQYLQRLWLDALKKDPQQVALRELHAILGSKIRKNMKASLALVSQGRGDAIFASAAAAVYARGIAQAMGFKHILVTEPDGAENYKTEKRDRTLALLKEKGWEARRRIFLTDHEEDLPLIQESHLVLWFGEDADVTSIKERAPQVEIVACRSRSSEEIQKLLFPAG